MLALKQYPQAGPHQYTSYSASGGGGPSGPYPPLPPQPQYSTPSSHPPHPSAFPHQHSHHQHLHQSPPRQHQHQHPPHHQQHPPNPSAFPHHHHHQNPHHHPASSGYPVPPPYQPLPLAPHLPPPPPPASSFHYDDKQHSGPPFHLCWRNRKGETTEPRWVFLLCCGRIGSGVRLANGGVFVQSEGVCDRSVPEAARGHKGSLSLEARNATKSQARRKGGSLCVWTCCGATALEAWESIWDAPQCRRVIVPDSARNYCNRTNVPLGENKPGDFALFALPWGEDLPASDSPSLFAAPTTATATTSGGGAGAGAGGGSGPTGGAATASTTPGTSRLPLSTSTSSFSDHHPGYAPLIPTSSSSHANAAAVALPPSAGGGGGASSAAPLHPHLQSSPTFHPRLPPLPPPSSSPSPPSLPLSSYMPVAGGGHPHPHPHPHHHPHQQQHYPHHPAPPPPLFYSLAQIASKAMAHKWESAMSTYLCAQRDMQFEQHSARVLAHQHLAKLSPLPLLTGPPQPPLPPHLALRSRSESEATTVTTSTSTSSSSSSSSVSGGAPLFTLEGEGGGEGDSSTLFPPSPSTTPSLTPEAVSSSPDQVGAAETGEVVVGDEGKGSSSSSSSSSAVAVISTTNTSGSTSTSSILTTYSAAPSTHLTSPYHGGSGAGGGGGGGSNHSTPPFAPTNTSIGGGGGGASPHLSGGGGSPSSMGMPPPFSLPSSSSPSHFDAIVAAAVHLGLSIPTVEIDVVCWEGEVVMYRASLLLVGGDAGAGEEDSECVLIVGGMEVSRRVARECAASMLWKKLLA